MSLIGHVRKLNINDCGRVAEGENRDCQEFAAAEKYKEKAVDDKAISVYNKYYKRYAARVKAGQSKETNFKKWKHRAISMRDECSARKVTLKECSSLQQMEDSFRNRNHKKSLLNEHKRSNRRDFLFMILSQELLRFSRLSLCYSFLYLYIQSQYHNKL